MSQAESELSVHSRIHSAVKSGLQCPEMVRFAQQEIASPRHSSLLLCAVKLLIGSTSMNERTMSKATGVNGIRSLSAWLRSSCAVDQRGSCLLPVVFITAISKSASLAPHKEDHQLRHSRSIGSMRLFLQLCEGRKESTTAQASMQSTQLRVRIS